MDVVVSLLLPAIPKDDHGRVVVFTCSSKYNPRRTIPVKERDEEENYTWQGPASATLKRARKLMQNGVHIACCG
jgi:hypothetical protein